jgi:hypothetical protein
MDGWLEEYVGDGVGCTTKVSMATRSRVLALISAISPSPVARCAARHHGDSLSVPAKQRRKPVLTGKGGKVIIANNSADTNAGSIEPIAGPTDGTNRIVLGAWRAEAAVTMLLRPEGRDRQDEGEEEQGCRRWRPRRSKRRRRVMAGLVVGLQSSTS